MRALSSTVQTLLAQQDVRYFHLVKIGPYTDTSSNTKTDLHTTVPGGVTIGSDNYTDNHNLLQVDSPRMSATVDKEAYKLTYADPTFDYRALFEKGFTGTPIQVWIGFYNSLTTSLNGILPGRPVNSYADCILAYQGTVDKTSYAVNMDEESIATMECSSPMGALGFTKSLLTSRDSLNQIDTTDTSFDQIFIGSKGLTLLWGKRQG